MKTKVLLKKLCLVVALVLAVVVWVAVYLLYLPFGIVRAFIDIDGFKARRNTKESRTLRNVCA